MRTAIVGASGYAGGELIRIADRHRHLSVGTLVAHSKAGSRLRDVHPNLPGGDRRLETLDLDELSSFEVVFLALPHGASAQPGEYLRRAGVVVVDLGSDFRLDTPERYRQAYGGDHPHPEVLGEWTYGLPELFAEDLKGARAIAVPGCYPTAALLALAPLIRHGVAGGSDVVVDAISGVTGAGRGLKESLLFGSVAEGVRPYGVGGHRHRPEMEMATECLGRGMRITFTPHLAPFQRGLIATVSVPAGDQSVDVMSILAEFYAKSPLVRVGHEPPSTRWVAGSDGAIVWGTHDDHSGRIVVIGAIDNLGKGAAGQAVQAFNVAMGFEETEGLTIDGWLS